MSDVFEPQLDAPIPGMSLTHELGARPWQNPPQYATVEDTLEFYLSRVGDEKLLYNILSVVENGVAIPTIAETLTLSGVMEGKHTVDVGVIVNPIITEFIKGLADRAGVSYTMDAQRDYTDMDITEADLDKAEKEIIESNTLNKETVEEFMDDITNKVEDEEPIGLMARPKQDEEQE